MSDTSFVTLFISHRDCEFCAKAAEGARIHASVTGSTGATYNDDRTRLTQDGRMHIATVKRASLVQPADYRDAQVKANAMMNPVPVQENRQAPAAEALATFLRDTATAAQAIPGSDVRKGVLRWANDQGYPVSICIALGDLVLQVVNYRDETIRAAARTI